MSGRSRIADRPDWGGPGFRWDLQDEVEAVFHAALRARRIPVELHIFGEGGHGFAVEQAGREWRLSITKTEA